MTWPWIRGNFAVIWKGPVTWIGSQLFLGLQFPKSWLQCVAWLRYKELFIDQDLAKDRFCHHAIEASEPCTSSNTRQSGVQGWPWQSNIEHDENLGRFGTLILSNLAFVVPERQHLIKSVVATPYTPPCAELYADAGIPGGLTLSVQESLMKVFDINRCVVYAWGCRLPAKQSRCHEDEHFLGSENLHNPSDSWLGQLDSLNWLNFQPPSARGYS